MSNKYILFSLHSIASVTATIGIAYLVLRWRRIQKREAWLAGTTLGLGAVWSYERLTEYYTVSSGIKQTMHFIGSLSRVLLIVAGVLWICIRLFLKKGEKSVHTNKP